MILKPRNLLVRTVFVLTELVVSGTQCKMFKIQAKCGNIQTEQEIERVWWRIKLSSRYCIPRLAENYRRIKGHFQSCQKQGNNGLWNSRQSPFLSWLDWQFFSFLHCVMWRHLQNDAIQLAVSLATFCIDLPLRFISIPVRLFAFAT